MILQKMQAADIVAFGGGDCWWLVVVGEDWDGGSPAVIVVRYSSGGGGMWRWGCNVSPSNRDVCKARRRGVLMRGGGEGGGPSEGEGL